MTIEIHSPNLQVSEKILDAIKKKIMALSHLSETISRAEIFLTEDSSLRKEKKVCKIRLSIFGDNLFVHKYADSFEAAATSAIRILKRLLNKKAKDRNTLPDEVISTVKV
jgi:ribosome-associated translation inhibitor RaiA